MLNWEVPDFRKITLKLMFAMTSKFGIGYQHLTWSVKFDFKYHILDSGWGMRSIIIPGAKKRLESADVVLEQLGKITEANFAVWEGLDQGLDAGLQVFP